MKIHTNLIHRVKLPLFLALPALFCMLSHSPLSGAEIQPRVEQNSILRQKDTNFLLGSGIGLLVNGICYAANWPILNTLAKRWGDELYEQDYVDIALHTLSNVALAGSPASINTNLRRVISDEAKQLATIRACLMADTLQSIGGNCIFSFFPDLNFVEVGNQILGGAGCYAGCKITERGYTRVMDGTILPYLKKKLPAKDYNSLPHFYKNPEVLTSVITPIALTAYSNFLYRRSEDRPINDCVKYAFEKGITRTISAYTLSCNIPNPVPQSILNLVQSCIAPNKAGVYRGISFSNSACMLALLAMNKDKLRDETPLVKSLALIGTGSLIARLAWLAYKQYKAPVNDLII